MGLPINIEDLIHGKAVEWERLEFKRGWNPEEIVHTICAFANDLNNWGGGYIIVGIDEDNGQAVLPPYGVEENQIDKIQGEVLKLSHQVLPNYFPIIQPYIIEEKHILVLWCPAGDHRPYTAPSTQGKQSQRFPYIRYGSRSIVAKGDNLNRLNSLASRIPFDDRVNHQATINDFSLGLIQAYLQEIKSDLFEESTSMPFADLCRAMHIAKGPDENLLPVNVGLLFFSKTPDTFFARTWIELVWHKDNSSKKFKEYYFKGALHKQLRDTLSFLKTNVIGEQVVKHADKAEADRFYNFPYDAVEEALSNAVYHKSYEIGSPIEVQVWPDKIEILSFPGPVPPVDAKILSTQKRIVAREYRNRRIGDFLKELHLTEGRGTGFPTIYKAMADNGSPAPVFETNEQSTHVLVTLPVHSLTEINKSDQASDQADDQDKPIVFSSLEGIIAFCNQATNQATNQASDQAKAILNDQVHTRVQDVLNNATNWIKRVDLFTQMGLSNHSTNRKKYLDPLIDLGWVEMEYPDKPTSPNQRYRITVSGRRLLDLINEEKK